MKNLIIHIVTICISFTVSTISYMVFSFYALFPPLDNSKTMTMLTISISIVSLMYIKSLLPIHHPALSRVIELFNVLIVLLLAGTVFDAFPVDKITFLLVIVIGLVTYFVVMGVGFGADLFTAQKINLAIERRRGIAHEENHRS